MKPGYESEKWREFLRKHDDLETYPLKCQNCGNQWSYCFCAHPVFQRMGEGE